MLFLLTSTKKNLAWAKYFLAPTCVQQDMANGTKIEYVYVLPRVTTVLILLKNFLLIALLKFIPLYK